MNSTRTSTDNSVEVIELDTSEDAIIDVCNNGLGRNDDTIRTIKDPSSTKYVITNQNYIEDVSSNNEQFSRPVFYNSVDVKTRPIFEVIFRDASAARQYREQIKLFFQDLIRNESVKIDDDPSSLVLQIWDNKDNVKLQVIDVSTESDNSQDIICDSLFTVDTQPQLKNDLDVPTYGKKYEQIFEKSSTESTPEKKDTFAPKMSCFNCLGNHNLRDCTEPRNQANITKNRKGFSVKGYFRAVRYHVDDDQRFGYMVPGQMSKTLRKALGLKENELPIHIYRMRILGYPPGWLEEARMQYSGLSLFNSDGVAEGDPEEEPGEIIAEGDRDEYDVKKIFDYPGFNVPPPPGTHDDHQNYQSSEMKAVQSKENMLLKLSRKRTSDGYRRKKLKLSVNSSTGNNTSLMSSDMEIDNLNETSNVESVPVNGHFIPPLPKESLVRPPPPEPPAPVQAMSEESDCQSQEDESTSSSRPTSPSLSDLESIKKQLLVELEDSSSQSNPETPVRCNILNSTAKSEMPPPSTEVTPDSNRTRSCRSTLNTSRGSVKSVDLGTPILQSTSPYSKLPSSKNFSKNICDVINFENLPESTGKYEQMTGVLQKVRDALAKINQD